MHLPSSIGNSVATSTAMVFIAGNAGAYATTGTALTTVATGLSNREQENTVGSIINSIIYDISLQPGTGAGGVIEYAIFKLERQSAVPTVGGTLPASATINTSGLQSAFRTLFPGRVLKFGMIPITEGTTAVKSIKGAYGKFKMAKIRTGDFYGIMFFNRTAQSVVISVQARYNEVK